MSVRSHVYSSCFARHTAESCSPFPGKNVSASRATEWTSKTVPYASKTSAAISCDIGPPGADATIGAPRPKVLTPHATPESIDVFLGIPLQLAAHAGDGEERGRHVAAARGSGRVADARAGRKRRRRGPRRGDHACGGRAHRE